GRADHRSAAPEENVRVAPDPQSDGHHGRDRLPARQAAQHQEQLGILRIDEYLRFATGFEGGRLAGAPFLCCGFAAAGLQHGDSSLSALSISKLLKMLV